MASRRGRELSDPVARERLVDQVPGFFATQELDALERAARRAPRAGGWFVEIGAYCGRSTLILGRVATQRSMRLLSVDHHLGSVEMRPPFPWADARLADPDLRRADSLGVARDTVALAGLDDAVVLWVGESRALLEVARQVAGLVLIDGGHDARSAHLDLEVARALLVPGGLLAVHDVFDTPQEGGLAPARMLATALGLGFELCERVGSLAVARRSTIRER